MNCCISQVADFLNQLDCLLLETPEHFFGEKLLDLMDSYLGVKYSVLEVYNVNAAPQTLMHNVDQALNYQYNEAFRGKDCFTPYIRENWIQISRSNRILLSTKIIPKTDYDQSEYVTFISEMGLYYSACMVFRGFYIAIHKMKSEGDFTPEEIEMLNSVYRILKNKYTQWRMRYMVASAHKREGELLSDLKIGLLVLGICQQPLWEGKHR